MTRRDPHARAVDAWLERAESRRGLDVDVIDAFERAFAALWRRAGETLGEVTLAAVTQRVLLDAVRKFPVFGSMRMMDDGGLRRRRGRARPKPRTEGDDARSAVRFFLTNWLSLLGTLTAGILSPALHDALSRVETAPPPGRGRAAPARKDRKS